MIRVIRIRQIETISRAEVESLIKRGVEKISYPGTTPDMFTKFLAAHIADPSMGVFVGFDEGVPQGVAITLLPTTAFMMYPQVILAYNEGEKAVAIAVGEKMRGWIVKTGYRHALAWHRGEPRSFMRATKHFGAARFWGSAVCYELI